MSIPLLISLSTVERFSHLIRFSTCSILSCGFMLPKFRLLIRPLGDALATFQLCSLETASRCLNASSELIRTWIKTGKIGLDTQGNRL